MNVPAVAKPKGRLTEKEARVIGSTANRLLSLRGLYCDCEGGSITVKQRTGSVTMAMTKADLLAALALLIERDSNFLSGFDIELDLPPP